MQRIAWKSDPPGILLGYEDGAPSDRQPAPLNTKKSAPVAKRIEEL
jgi:hypothetical protein